MPDSLLVKSFVEDTAAVEPARAFEFWRDTALALSGVNGSRRDMRRPFAASRLVAQTANGTLLHTRSSGIAVERSAARIRRDGRDDVTLAMTLRGRTYFEQGGNGALLAPGSIGLTVANRPYAVGSTDDYEEIRLIVSRAAFRTHVGEPEAFIGRRLRASEPDHPFSTQLRAYAGAIAGLSEAEAEIGLTGLLHLLRDLAGAPGAVVSAEAMRALAAVRIDRRLHDPDFGPEALWRDLGTSRSRLYAAFSGGPGVAAEIRDARLDRAYRRLSGHEDAGRSIFSILHECGFTDPSAFSNAFRRRFGRSARAVRAELGA